MHVIVLGGTRFIGRAIVDALVAAGHDPRVCHRSATKADGLQSLERRASIVRKPTTFARRLGLYLNESESLDQIVRRRTREFPRRRTETRSQPVRAGPRERVQCRADIAAC
jgi:nucleoside-diphosphate-sugar epimerase